MTDKLFQLKSFTTYWLDAVNAHSLHSPFLYNFYSKVVLSNEKNANLKAIEEIRKELLGDARVVNISDLGAGSQVLKSKTRRVSDIARTSLSSVKYANIYARLTSYFQCQSIFELGTSLGVNTLYLASSKESEVTTFEGSSEIASVARQSFVKAEAKNIRIIEGNLDNTLVSGVQSTNHIDLAFMDANHRFEPTLRYFEILIQKMNERSIVIVDDIHYSEEMDRAWNKLKQHHRVRASADLYRCGILFFDPSLNNQHVVLQC